MDFKLVKPKAVVSPKLTLKLEIELNNSTLTPDEAATRLQLVIDGSRSSEFSSLIVMLLRETKSSTWEMKSLEIT